MDDNIDGGEVRDDDDDDDDVASEHKVVESHEETAFPLSGDHRPPRVCGQKVRYLLPEHAPPQQRILCAGTWSLIKSD